MARRFLSKIGFMFTDVVLAWIAFALGIIVTSYDVSVSQLVLGDWKKYVFACAILFVVLPIVSYCLKAHTIMWRYAGMKDLLIFGVSTTISYVMFFCMHYSIIEYRFDLRTYIIGYIFVGTILTAMRLIVRLASRKTEVIFTKTKHTKKRIMIIGGGSAGVMLLRDISQNKGFADSRVECIIDDNSMLLGRSVYGVDIVGNRDTIISNAEKYDITTIIFAIPTCAPSDKANILEICSKTGCEIKTLPSIDQIIEKGYGETHILNVEIEDLLGRSPIVTDVEKIAQYVQGKVVMVTGGGGSIGSELCRQIAAQNPKQLIIFDIYENSTYDIQNELIRTYPNLNIVALIGSVRDVKRLDCVFGKYKPQLVYHAAAHKHVPLMEVSPNESVKNNVFGTLNTVQMADKYGVERFVMISTDKAVNPTNIMGASKRMCEMIIQYYNKYSETDFVAVRFGNVLGSNGSVIPLFKKQIAEGGPVTVTHPEIIRYFMTIPEAVSLVLQAGVNAHGGEIFVLDMGKPVKILSLAENLIRLSGYEPYKDIDIKFTGLRPGEKLYEELLMAEEGLHSTENNLIFICKPIVLDDAKFFGDLHNLKQAVYDDNTDIISLVEAIVPTFKHESNQAAQPTKKKDIVNKPEEAALLI